MRVLVEDEGKEEVEGAAEVARISSCSTIRSFDRSDFGESGLACLAMARLADLDHVFFAVRTCTIHE